MELTIEKDSPMPAGKKAFAGATPRLRAALSRMEVGESFLVETYSDKQHVYDVAKEIGRRVTVRKVDGGWRIWRRS